MLENQMSENFLTFDVTSTLANSLICKLKNLFRMFGVSKSQDNRFVYGHSDVSIDLGNLSLAFMIIFLAHSCKSLIFLSAMPFWKR
jgi:hypothetical protein